MQFRPEKFRELMLYIARAQADDSTFGRVKLEKLLFYSDVEAFARFGEAITGADYKKDTYGPTAFQSREIKAELIRNEEAIERDTEAWGMAQVRLVPYRESDTSLFSTEELALVDEIINEHRGMSATEISKKSHRDMGWRIAKHDDLIPYESVFLAPEAPAEIIDWARNLIHERGWVEAQ